MDLGGHDLPAWARRARALGFTSLRATPLWHEERRVGSMVLLWAGDPPIPMNVWLLEQTGRHVASAIASVDARWKIAARRRDESRASRAGPGSAAWSSSR